MATEDPRKDLLGLDEVLHDNVAAADIREIPEQVRFIGGSMFADHSASPISSDGSLLAGVKTRIDTVLFPDLVAEPFSGFPDIVIDTDNGTIMFDEIPGVLTVNVDLVIGFSNSTDCTLQIFRDGVLVPGAAARADGRGLANETPLSLSTFTRTNAILTNPFTEFDVRLTMEAEFPVDLFSYSILMLYIPFTKNLGLT